LSDLPWLQIEISAYDVKPFVSLPDLMYGRHQPFVFSKLLANHAVYRGEMQPTNMRVLDRDRNDPAVHLARAFNES
jgi:hypothetical protein